MVIDERTRLMLQEFEASEQRVNKEELEKKTWPIAPADQQMQDITAELADKGFLRHVGEGLYMTTEDGYKFIGASSGQRPSILSNKEMNDLLPQ